MDSYERLANAIILQACKDFRAAYKRLKRFPDSRHAQDEVKDLTEFFCSQHFELLTNADGPSILHRMMREIDKKEGGDAR